MNDVTGNPSVQPDIPDGERLVAQLFSKHEDGHDTNPKAHAICTLRVNIALLVGQLVEPQRPHNNAPGSYLYPSGTRPSETFVVQICDTGPLIELAKKHFKPFPGFHVHDNTHTNGSVVCWPQKIETSDQAKEILIGWLGLIGALIKSSRDDINDLLDSNNPNSFDDIINNSGVRVVLNTDNTPGIGVTDGHDSPAPGTFHTFHSMDLGTNDINSQVSIQLFENEYLINAVKQAKIYLPKDPSILYPASGGDISLEKVFLKEYITYLDPDHPTCELLRTDSNRNVIEAGIPTKSYSEKHDMVVLVNKNGNIGPDDISHYLNEDGIVFAQGNGWNFDAEEFLPSPLYTLIGVIDKLDGDLKTSDIREYSQLEPLDTNQPTETKKFCKVGAWYVFRKK